ncbi:MAG: hypothetical protein QM539_10925 [Alphaproteobacteria bacterium]|nr:hypothetical protein [Alphaproteobacteria bacterium]
MKNNKENSKLKSKDQDLVEILKEKDYVSEYFTKKLVNHYFLTSNYEEYNSKRLNRKRLINCILFILLEIILICKLIIFIKEENQIGDFFFFYGKGQIIVKIFVLFSLILESFISISLLICERYYKVDWVWCLIKFDKFGETLKEKLDHYLLDENILLEIRNMQKLLYKLNKFYLLPSFHFVYGVLFFLPTIYLWINEFTIEYKLYSLLWAILLQFFSYKVTESIANSIPYAYTVNKFYMERLEYTNRMFKLFSTNILLKSINNTVKSLLNLSDKVLSELYYYNSGLKWTTIAAYISIPYIDLIFFCGFVTDVFGPMVTLVCKILSLESLSLLILFMLGLIFIRRGVSYYIL